MATTSFNKLVQLKDSGKEVFRIDDLATIWGYTDYEKVQELARYYTSRGELYRQSKGVYTQSPSISTEKIALQLQVPSYITYHTALQYHGINFQFYNSIHLAAQRTKHYIIRNTAVKFHKLKDEILFLDMGINLYEGMRMASPERAICDSLYLSPQIAFDNIEAIDKTTILQIAEGFKSAKLLQNIKNLL